MKYAILAGVLLVSAPAYSQNALTPPCYSHPGQFGQTVFQCKAGYRVCATPSMNICGAPQPGTWVSKVMSDTMPKSPGEEGDKVYNKQGVLKWIYTGGSWRELGGSRQ